ncbi:glycerophosphodiester phosphodiesterase 1 [Strongylocentrotus purpuratus]|uniref:GP-PDE domain-containing protein n=1 Tax=Strongylocentrotus purpuratus TaxID=7668 RepID=A0A7M7RC58_STRPU|nr:glycerophosphodiester phosphodiesterase 1 [Strongylocentrotus purpuratus]
MVPESLGLAGAEVVLDFFCQSICFSGFIFVISYCTFWWFLPSHVIVVLSVLSVISGVACLLYFRKRRPADSHLERFMKPSASSNGVIAHRGGAADAPENTLLAIQEAKKNGADGVEVDVEITKDGVAILMHDATIDRTTDGTGFIGQMMWDEVSQLNAAAKFSSSSRSKISYEAVPTLDEVVQECLNLKLRIFFDVKAYSKQMVDELIKLYQKYPGLYDNGMICSFFPTTIYRVRQLDSEILTALTTEPYFISGQVMKRWTGPPTWWKLLPFAIIDKILEWSLHNWLWILCGNSAMLLQKDTISLNVIRYWSARGLTVIPWTVNKKTDKEFLASLDCHYITDCIK